MNIENIQSLLRESFKEDGIQKEDIFTSLKKTKNEFHDEEYDYEVSENFKEYIYDLCSRTFFYEYSQNMIEKDDDEELEDIKKEIEYDTISIQKEEHVTGSRLGLLLSSSSSSSSREDSHFSARAPDQITGSRTEHRA